MVWTNEKQFLHEGTELSAKVKTLFDAQFTETNVEAEVCFIIQLLHIIHYHEREFNKQFERPFCLALIVQRQKNTQSTIWRKRKQIQVAMIRRFPGFYASGWLLKLQAELERVAQVRNIMLKSKWIH